MSTRARWAVSSLLAVTSITAGFIVGGPQIEDLIRPTTALTVRTASAAGVSDTVVDAALSATTEQLSSTLSTDVVAAAEASVPGVTDIISDPSVMDQVFAERENDRVTLANIEMSWLMAAAVQLATSNNVQLLQSSELKWKLGVALDELDSGNEYRRMTTHAQWVSEDESGGYNHWELPAEEDRTESVTSDIDATKNLYLALGRLIGLSESDAQTAYDVGLKWALGQQTQCGKEGTGTLSGSDNLEKIFNWLQTDLGLTLEQASGVVANIQVESAGNGDPWKAEIGYNFSTNAGWGIVQWTGPRHIKVRDYVIEQIGERYYVSQYSSPPAAEQLSTDDIDLLLQTQLAFMKQELEGSYAAVLEGVKNSSTPEQASEIWVRQYERPLEIEDAVTDRAAMAREWYESHGGSGSTNSENSENGSSSDTSQVCDGASDDGVPQFVGDIAMPLATMVAGSNYGPRVHPISGQLRFHYGTDYPVATGTAVFSIADGTVQHAGTLGSCGIAVQIFHNINGNQIATMYCHLSEVQVSVGDTVTKGQQIGLSGNTGGSTGPHLHFEVRTSWKFEWDYVTAMNSVDADAWLKAQASS